MSKPIVSAFSLKSLTEGLHVGSRFAFKLGDKPGIIPLVGVDNVTINGFTIKGVPIDTPPVASLIPSKMVFSTKEPVHLLLACPGQKEATVSLLLNREAIRTLTVSLDVNGCGILSVTNLGEGQYIAQLPDGSMSASFLVAKHQLLPLHATFTKKPELEGINTTFTASLVSYDTPVNGNVRVELMQGTRCVQNVDAVAADGAVTATLTLPKGEETLTVNFHAAGQAASLPLRGAREKERTPFTAVPLGQTVKISTLPPGEEIRGLFVTLGPITNTPVVIDRLVDITAKVEIRDENVTHVTAVMVDPQTKKCTIHVAQPPRTDGWFAMRVPDPYGMLFIGAIINGKPWEGWSMVMVPESLKVEVTVPETVLPGDEVVVKVKTNKEGVSLFALATDGRAVTPTTVRADFAAAMKAGAEQMAKDAVVGTPPNAFKEGDFSANFLQQVYMNTYRELGGGLRTRGFPRHTMLPEPRDIMLGASFASSVKSVGLEDEAVYGSSEVEQVEMIEELSEEMGATVATMEVGGVATAVRVREKVAAPPDARKKAPATVCARLITLENDSGSFAFRAPEDIIILNLLVQAVAGCEAVVIEKKVEVTKPLFAKFDVAPFVSPGDVAKGSVTVGCKTGQFSIRLFYNDKPVTIWRKPPHSLSGKDALEPMADGTLFSENRETFLFPLQPGTYRVGVADSEHQDVAEAQVTEPGTFSRTVKELRVLLPGERIEKGSDTLSLAVQPGIENALKVCVHVSADYSHACCQQTAAKIEAASVLFLGGNPDDRRKAEDIILAGIEREKMMFVSDRGFQSYPGRGDAGGWLSQAATRHLLAALGPLSRCNLSPGLSAACKEGLGMAKDAARAHKLAFPPATVHTCKDAYEAVVHGGKERHHEAVQCVASMLEPAGSFSAVKDRSGKVAQRAETAYAAAVLFLCRSSLECAVKAANFVCAQFTSDGGLYSTEDNAAAIAMLSAMKEVGVVETGGSVTTILVNGKEMVLGDALKCNDVQVVEVPSGGKGVVAVQVVKNLAEDWNTFQSGVPVAVTLLQDNKVVQKVHPQKPVSLVVSLTKGYQLGDLVQVCLPPSLSFVVGGVGAKQTALDFEGQDELVIPLAVTGPISSGSQTLAVVVRNMFKEERAGSPGPVKVTIG